ncbi:OsmC family protein [Celeribacter arenosi]|uniref:OsmC family peroxiredoxin n=1 Tax=Celeribacter arenosi TaxID=792649 RepID=A0ABP7JU98_9RHOB
MLPLNGLMRGQLESLFKLRTDSKELATVIAVETYAPLFTDPGDHFGMAKETAGDLTLLEPIGLTPRMDVVLGTIAASGSLADVQDRRLDIGAVATLREDGIKEIQQMQCSPYGTSFRFLSSEDGRAPDAISLISADIGFCFMTQFGRFASILKLGPPEYRVVQDTHFNLCGASGVTGKAGEADPIETHVYLQTSETDEVAQEMLDNSEQTCFLHAFCRTDVKTKPKIVRA